MQKRRGGGQGRAGERRRGGKGRAGQGKGEEGRAGQGRVGSHEVAAGSTCISYYTKRAMSVTKKCVCVMVMSGSTVGRTL